ncbi:MAG: isochorismatase family protein [Betaproteobacteria bacterium]|nr:isochorismatase family protein [Betaproteobacteria bacterium]
MTISALDPTPALIVIDLQKGIAALPTAHPVSQIAQRAGALAAAFRRHQLPVVLVNVAGTAPGRTQQGRRLDGFPADWTDLLPELGHAPQDLTVTKRTWGAFTHSDLAERLKALGVTQVVVCGVSTSIGVESTARQAYEIGFHVALAADAMTDTNPRAHANSLEAIFPRLGEIGSTQEIIALLDAARG